MPVIILFIVIWYLSLFSQTFFLHRYAAHGAFKMNRFWERFFHMFVYIAQGPHYISPRTYAIMHRLHHAHTDTENDPHSPNYSKNIVAMMWRTRRIYNDIFHKRMDVEEKYLKNLPEWNALDRWANSTPSRMLWTAAYVAFFAIFATAPWQWILLPVLLGLAAIQGGLVNWFAHRVGYRNFWMKNSSKNLFTMDVLLLGEAYHNNHHKHPSALNYGYHKHEIDPTYAVIRLFAKMGILQIPDKATRHANSTHRLKLKTVNETENSATAKVPAA